MVVKCSYCLFFDVDVAVGESAEAVDNRSLQEILSTIPPPPPPAMSSEPGAPRLMITHIVNRNFKSYAGEQILGPFHKVQPSVLMSLCLISKQVFCKQPMFLPFIYSKIAVCFGKTLACISPISFFDLSIFSIKWLLGGIMGKQLSSCSVV